MKRMRLKRRPPRYILGRWQIKEVQSEGQREALCLPSLPASGVRKGPFKYRPFGELLALISPPLPRGLSGDKLEPGSEQLSSLGVMV